MAFTIKELESLTGIKAHTIRIWEQRYHFLKPDRTATNIRTYSNEELKTLLTVALLNKYGYKISRIDGMVEEQRNTELLQIENEEAKNEYLINQLIGCMVDMNAHELEHILSSYIQQHGIQPALQTIIFPFLSKVGILWQTDRINPAHEHMVSNIIRQKIIAATEALPVAAKDPSFVLFLPEGEYHELGLLVVNYLLRQKGCSVLYLGANVPFKDICYVAEKKDPAYLYTHITTTSRHFNLSKYIDTLRSHIPQATLIFSGLAMQAFKKEVPSKLIILKSLPDLTTYISSI